LEAFLLQQIKTYKKGGAKMRRQRYFIYRVFFYTLTAFLIILPTNGSFGLENNDLIPVPGDLTGDAVVDVADYQELRKTLGKCEGDTGFNSEADYDFDGCVSYRDYRIWYDMYQDYGYSQTPPGPVMATGQTRSYREGDDGDLQLGVPCPVPRFIDNGDGTVKDNCTGLIWLKNANCFGRKRWHAAIDASNGLEDGQCGLSDDSIAGDWHLPNIRELLSLVDYGNYRPVLGI
jgi:hypothetical protein